MVGHSAHTLHGSVCLEGLPMKIHTTHPCGASIAQGLLKLHTIWTFL